MDAQSGAGHAIRDQLASFLSLVTTQVDSLEAQNRALLAERDRLGNELALKQAEAQEAQRRASDAQAILDAAIAEQDKRRQESARYADLIRAQAHQAAMSLRELAERIEADAKTQAAELENAVRGVLSGAAASHPVQEPAIVPVVAAAEPDEETAVVTAAEPVEAMVEEEAIAEIEEPPAEPEATPDTKADLAQEGEDRVTAEIEAVDSEAPTPVDLDMPALHDAGEEAEVEPVAEAPAIDAVRELDVEDEIAEPASEADEAPAASTEPEIAPRSPVVFPALSPVTEPRAETPPSIVPPVSAGWKPEVVGRSEPEVEPPPVHEAAEPEDHRSGWQGAVINGRPSDEAAEAPVAPAGNEPVTYDVVARPFTNFSSLVTFQKAIREISGVGEVRVRVFQNNALSMSLSYDGARDVGDALSMVGGFDVTEIVVEGNRVEMTVVSTASKASA